MSNKIESTQHPERVMTSKRCLSLPGECMIINGLDKP
jgi:hypothetical protein